LQSLKPRRKLITGLGIVALSLVGVTAYRADIARTQPPLLVDFPFDPIQPESWDPTTSKVDYEVAMVQALYSPLLELDDNAQLKPGWAESFTWKDAKTLRLVLRSEHRLANGSPVTADDAAYSLKRMAYKMQDEDAFYVEQFCLVPRLKAIDEPCPGLVAEGQTLTIRTRDPIAILPQLLTAVETSLVPRKALAADGLSLRELGGSGPYRLDALDPARISLLANPEHFNFHSQMPQKVILVPSVDATPESLAEAFQARRIDHVARFSALNVFESRRLAERLRKNVHTSLTLPMGVGALLFSESARQRLPVAARQDLVLHLQRAVHACIVVKQQDHVRQPTRTLIPATGIGVLSSAEERELDRLRRAHVRVELRERVKIRFPSSIRGELLPCLEKEVAGLPLEFSEQSGDANDLQFKSLDLSTYEELGTIRAMLTLGLLHAGGVTSEEWIRDYLQEPGLEPRLARLKAAHRRSIWDDPTVIPLWHFETGALVRKPWMLKFSPISISNPFHLIRYAD
jgi:hypothetical protein